MRFAASCNKDAEDLAFDEERSHHKRMQSRRGELLWERHLHVPGIRFIDQLPADATAQTVGIDGNMRLFRERQFEPHWQASRTHVNDRQLLARWFVIADAAKIKM